MVQKKTSTVKKKTKEKSDVKRKPGGQQKYNWAELKKEFFESEHLEVKIFFQEKFNIYNGSIGAATAGWTAEKKEIKMEAANNAIRKMRDEMEGELHQFVVDIVREAKRQLKERVTPTGHDLDVYDEEIGIKKKKTVITPQLSSSDLKNFFEIVKTELGEPSKVTKQNNITIPPSEAVNEEDRKELDEILKRNNLI